MVYRANFKFVISVHDFLNRTLVTATRSLHSKILCKLRYTAKLIRNTSFYQKDTMLLLNSDSFRIHRGFLLDDNSGFYKNVKS